MNRTEKEQLVASLRHELSGVEAVYLADYRGLTVEQVNGVRRGFRQEGFGYLVVKNTMLKLAVDGTALEPLTALLEGPTAVVYSKEDPLGPAKILVKLAKDLEPLEIKGGFFEGLRTAEDVEALSRMPGKDGLRAMLLATMLAAPQNLLRLFTAAPQRLLMALEARKRQLEG